jgi:hypothetical protein
MRVKPRGMRGRSSIGGGFLGGVLSAVLWCGGLQAADAPDSKQAVDRLRTWLAKPVESRGSIAGQPFAKAALTAADAERAADLLWTARLEDLRRTRKAEMDAKRIEASGKVLRYEVVRFGSAEVPPPGGRSLFISMHGGGGAPARVNDSQWTNQVRLGKGYAPQEGIYVAPRAPTDTWNLWHEAHIDVLFARLVENFVALEGVNPDRVYIMGYSAGGDGVYQLAPRMADWWAGAAMSAGHPNETQPFGLRNVPFALQVGELDAAYRRNAIAAEWGAKLQALHAADPGGYENLVKIPAGKPHWMGMEDRVAIPWMEARTRKPLPDRVAWRQDDVLHPRFYWLGVPEGTAKAEQQIVASRSGAVVTVEASDAPQIRVLWNDAMADLDKGVQVTLANPPLTLWDGKVERTIGTLSRTLEERGDRRLMFSAEVLVRVP